MSRPSDLDLIFRPRSVAVVGVSSRPDGLGGQFVLGLINQGHPHIYPVNPKATEILRLTASPALRAIPGPVDHVVSCVPAAAVLQLLDDVGAKGVRSMQLFTAADRAYATGTGGRSRTP